MNQQVQDQSQTSAAGRVWQAAYGRRRTAGEVTRNDTPDAVWRPTRGRHPITLAGSRPKPRASGDELMGDPPIPDVPRLGRTEGRRSVVVQLVAVAEDVARGVQVEHRHI